MAPTTVYRLLRRPFIIFTFILLFKGYLAWMSIFDTGLTWKPLVTEIPFIWLLFSLIELFVTKRKLMAYMIVNILVTAIFFAAIMYHKYYGVIVTYHALEQVNQVTAVSNSVLSLLAPYYLFIFTDIVVFVIWFFSSKRSAQLKQLMARKERRSIIAAILALSLNLCLFNIMPNRASMNEIVKAQEMGILNYEAYTILANKDENYVDASQITQDTIDQIKQLKPVEMPHSYKAAAGKNLIIIQLESFQNFLINLKIDGKEITPNMNQLVKEGMYFPKFYQQVGQGNTSDAEFVVYTSCYIPNNEAATQNYAYKELPSLPKLLKQSGYQTATFHTNVVEFWNRGELYKGVGFDRYYDKSFFGEDDKVFFGSSDEVLYAKTAEQLKKMNESGQPFYSQIISMSAHHPFTIPDTKYKMTLPDRYDNTFVGDYIRAQNYADYALGGFIKQLKDSGIWDNSLIVLYGDHLGLPIYSLDNDDKELMKEIYGREYRPADMINIPLIIINGGQTTPQVMDQVGGQVDILPTVANLLGVPVTNQIHFGQDLLNQPSNLLPERYYLPSGSFVNDHSVFIPGTEYADGTQYALKPGEDDGQKATEDEYKRALRLLLLSDSYVNGLPDRREQGTGE
ncbi:LTA synthase family protein [Paenibacillus sediminis]|uniref:Phosphoglycerol transferase MdoB-like AlkP superfamily enzyme n=1 Tax=Paenibacillus sediminis TaxID=664909 RepID=A0ABS4H2M2_9BACL|nr:phosphoglycerol transferase MdoB-like AlkP superfamily enzyme [Paenibacillus sediminis]